MMKGGLGHLMKQAQQMQENMQQAQEELQPIEVEGQSGAGLVKVIDDLQVRREEGDASTRASSARTRTCSRTSSWPR